MAQNISKLIEDVKVTEYIHYSIVKTVGIEHYSKYLISKDETLTNEELFILLKAIAIFHHSFEKEDIFEFNKRLSKYGPQGSLQPIIEVLSSFLNENSIAVFLLTFKGLFPKFVSKIDSILTNHLDKLDSESRKKKKLMNEVFGSQYYKEILDKLTPDEAIKFIELIEKLSKYK